MQKDNNILHYETNNNERNKMMINTPKESDFQLKQEAQSTNHEKAKASSTNSSTSSQWLKLKDPRIVRVSRAFGGKDRHSKVFTIRGLRDRRVRLSVPTAIHLYDLQDRLGLNQPSKVVDWLLNVAKDEIDELPPLPIAPENFTLGYPSLSINNTNDVNQIWKSKSKQVLGEMVSISEEEDKHVAKRCCEKLAGNSAGNRKNSSNEHVSPNNMLPIGLLNTMPLGYQLEHFPGDVSQIANFGFVNQIGDIQHGINVVPFPSSSLSLSTGNSNTSGSSQILVCPSGVTQPYFPSHVATMEMDPRQINQYHQMLMSSSYQSNSLNILPQHLMRMSTPKLFHSPNNGESHSHRDQDFPSK